MYLGQIIAPEKQEEAYQLSIAIKTAILICDTIKNMSKGTIKSKSTHFNLM
jgi:hypothetical protein